MVAPSATPFSTRSRMRSSCTGATIAPMSTALSSGADAQLLHPRAQLLDQALGDAFLHQQPRARAADLALVEPDRVDDAFDHAVEIGVLEDDERTLAAELERELLAGAGGACDG